MRKVAHFVLFSMNVSYLSFPLFCGQACGRKRHAYKSTMEAKSIRSSNYLYPSSPPEYRWTWFSEKSYGMADSFTPVTDFLMKEHSISDDRRSREDGDKWDLDDGGWRDVCIMWQAFGVTVWLLSLSLGGLHFYYPPLICATGNSPYSCTPAPSTPTHPPPTIISRNVATAMNSGNSCQWRKVTQYRPATTDRALNTQRVFWRKIVV